MKIKLITSMNYLKDKQHYIDRYDLLTIKECLEVIDFCTKVYVEMGNKEEAKKFSLTDKAKGTNWMTNQYLFLAKACRYEQKEETINKWTSDDSVKQEKYETTSLPKNILCTNCNKSMQSTLKHLETLDDPMRMMFLFECTLCRQKKWIYEDGSERESKPQLCPKCNHKIKLSVIKESKDKIIYKTTCPFCDFSEITTDDLGKRRSKWKEQEEQDKKLLLTYREQFCSEENGKEAFDYVEASKVAKVVYNEEFKKYDSQAYQQIIQLKKLTVVELEKLLNPLLKEKHFVKLSLNNPEIGKYFIVPFSIQDNDSMRKQEASVSSLEIIIKEALEGTNWRLMSDGLSYRLGYISGRLKGYENEEDFFELVGKKKEPEQPKIDYDTRMKYEGHNVVQFAHFSGEFAGIQNARKRRLEKEPGGFFLEESDGVYQCGICRENTPSSKTWWNLDGVRCADCQRNIKKGVIPAEIDKNDDLWIKDWQLTSDNYFDINPGKIKKLRREGLLVGHDLNRENGTIYETVYLVSENEEFLKKYPKKPLPKHFITDLLGNKIEL